MTRPRSVVSALVFVAGMVAFVAIVLAAPSERTLGSGIRAVYVHVPLTWTGMAAFSLAAVFGAIALAQGGSSGDGFERWGRAFGLVGLCAYGGGVAVSLLAARINWGVVLWSEPRLGMSLRVLGLALAVQLVAPHLESVRARGAARVAVAAFMVWALMATPLYVHPRNPIGTSGGWEFRATFYSLFALCAAGAAFAAVQLRRRFAVTADD